MPRLGVRLGVALGGDLGESLSGLLPVTSGLVAHWRGDKGITLNGTTVSAWADQAPGGTKDLAQATATYQPTYTAHDSNFNSWPTVSFDGTDNFMTCDALASTVSGNDQPVSIVWASSWTSAGNFFHAGKSTAVNPRLRWQIIAGNPGINFQRFDDGGTSQDTSAQTGTMTSSPAVHSVVFSGTAVTWRQNATAKWSSVTVNVGTCTFDTFTVGAKRENGETFSVQAGVVFAEIAIYNRALSAQEVAQVESMMQVKYL